MKVTAIARRSNEWWALSVPELPGVFTQVKSLPQAKGVVVDAVRTMLEDPTADVEVVDVKVQLGDPLESLTKSAAAAVSAQAEASERVRVAMERAILGLREAQLSTRDVATLLGVSHQRVSQIGSARQRTSANR